MASAISNFSVTFSIVSILTGLTTTFNTGLTYGGPLTMIYGWPIVGVFTLFVGFSMAEICSAFPTSGGLYFWSAKLCGNEWGPFASWLTGWYVVLLSLCRVYRPDLPFKSCLGWAYKTLPRKRGPGPNVWWWSRDWSYRNLKKRDNIFVVEIIIGPLPFSSSTIKYRN